MAQQQAIMAGGCFWCTEAVMKDVVGVSEVESGYIGGDKADPTYKEVCSGSTGHAEAVRVTFEDQEISLAELYDVFMGTHDPSQLNRQGNDIGTQYRSAIYTDEADLEQQALASRAAYQLALKQAGRLAAITTEIGARPDFYFAEAYHQQYLAKNPQGYCGLGGLGVCYTNPADSLTR